MKSAPSQTRVVRFGVFEVDLQEHELRRSGLRRKLGPQPFQVLQAMLERPGELLTRDELRKRLWADDTFIDYELALKKCVNRIREVLGDSANNPRFVETVPRHGYRFIAPVQQVSGNSIAPPPDVPDSALIAVTPAQHEAAEAVFPNRPLTRKVVSIASAVVLAALGVTVYLFVAGRKSVDRSVAAHPITALAVLPLDNLSSGKDSVYYAEGMTDELITQIAKISGVRIISRTSVMPFATKRESLQQIARALRVDAVVEGTVFRSGTRVRITAQLIQVNPEKHLWQDSYEREERDVLTLQSELAEDIARKINAKITPRGRERINGPVNVEAHEAYLRGRYWWHHRGREAELKGLQYFQRAVELDPSYAPGWAGLADSYIVMAHHGALLPNDAMPKANAAVTKALEFDNSLAEAHASLATIKLSYSWDYSAAEREFKRAIELNSNYATAHHWYAHYLVIMGRFPEALNEIQLAHQLDPYSVVINVWLGDVFYYERDYPRAAAQFQSILDLDANTGPAVYESLANVFEQEGNLAQALNWRRRELEADGRPQDAVLLADAYRIGGPKAYWRRRIEQVQRTAKTETMPLLELAILHAHEGNRDAALRSLESAFDEHSPWLNFMAREPAFDSLRANARFQRLSYQIGLK